MKKKISIILAAAILMPMAISCNEWLEEKPYKIAVETYYNNAAECESAIYAVTRAFYNATTYDFNFPSFLECASDNLYGGGSWESDSFYEAYDVTNQGRTDGVWSRLYTIVRDANIVIANVPNASDLSEAEKTAFIAEARFFRGWAYMLLSRHFGHCPLRTEENMTEWELGMTPEAEIWDFLRKDFEFAAANLPEKSASPVRPSRLVGKVLLAEVYMWDKNFAAAKPLLEEVINSGNYKLVTVKTSRDFDNLFGYQVSTTPEEVFYVKTTETSGYGYGLYRMYANNNVRINGQKMSVPSGWCGISSSTDNKWVKNWDDNDLRKNFNCIVYDLKKTCAGFKQNIIVGKFWDPVHSGGYSCTCDNPLYRYADVLIMAAECINEVNNGPTAQAMEYINMIHRRAYGEQDVTKPSAVDFALSDYNTKEKFMALITQEQCYEFWGEGKRWNFLLRTGQEKKYVKEYKDRDIKPEFYKWRIPPTEFERNLALDLNKDQNPGY